MKAILLDEAKKWLEENCENQYTRMAVFGIMQSMPTVDYQKTPNEPLTLEQLRDMDGEVVLIGDSNGIIAEKAFVKAERGFLSGQDRTKYYFECLGKTYFAYAYQPAHIDREAWTAEWKEYTGADAGFHYCSKCGQQAFNYENGGEVVEVLSEFCPSCGKAMTPEA